MTDNLYLKIAYVGLNLVLLSVFIIWFFIDISSQHIWGVPRGIGLGVLAIEVMVFVWLTDRGWRKYD